MGLYYTTNLCSGTFLDTDNQSINKKIKIASHDPIIEAHEWELGQVDLGELVTYLSIKHNTPRGDIQLQALEGSDLFLEELCWSSMDVDTSDVDTSSSKYILIEKNYTYTMGDCLRFACDSNEKGYYEELVAARSGLINAALICADAGYIQRKAIKQLENIKLETRDCVKESDNSF